MFFLHIIIGTVFIVPIIDQEEILGRKQFSVFPLAKAQCGNHPPQGSTADV